MKSAGFGTTNVLVIAFTVLAFHAAVEAEEQRVVEWVRIDTHGGTDIYLDGLADALARMKALAPEMNSRAFEAAYAGRDTGSVYVMNDYPNLDYMAKTLRILKQDIEWQQALERLRATGRTIESESLLFEVTPRIRAQ